MNNPFEGKAIKFDTSEQLDHLAELAKGYGLDVGSINEHTKGVGYFRLTSNLAFDYYTNCYTANNLHEIHYFDFVMNIEAQKYMDSRPTQQPDMVNHPPHYTVNGIEVIDVIKGYKLCYLLGNVIKYVLRCNFKGNKKQDLQKAAWYLNRAISELE